MVTGKRCAIIGHSMGLLLLILPQAVFAADWQWMKPQRLHSLLSEGSGLWLVDVRNPAAFEHGHIEGAIHVPAEIVPKKQFPAQKMIVLVDDSLGLKKAWVAATALAAS